MTPVEPTEVRPAPSRSAEPPSPGGSAGRRNVAALALATACGFLLGVLVVVTVGDGGGSTTTEVQRVTVSATGPTAGQTVIVKTLVPAMVGEPLDVAKQRADRGNFVVTVDAGAGILGVLRDANWEVVAQRPEADQLVEQGSTIHVDIVKR